MEVLLNSNNCSHWLAPQSKLQSSPSFSSIFNINYSMFHLMIRFQSTLKSSHQKIEDLMCSNEMYVSFDIYFFFKKKEKNELQIRNLSYKD